MILEKNQDKTFTFDRITGNLMKRTDEIQHLSERFSYDPVLKSRLTSWQVLFGQRLLLSHIEED